MEITVYFSDEVFSLSMPSVCPHLTTVCKEQASVLLSVPRDLYTMTLNATQLHKPSKSPFGALGQKKSKI